MMFREGAARRVEAHPRHGVETRQSLGGIRNDIRCFQLSSLRRTTWKATAIDNRRPGLLRSKTAFLPDCAAFYGSHCDVFRAVSAKLRPEWGFVLMGALCSLGTAGDSRAAGCHVSDRPVLSSKLSADLELAIDLSVVEPARAPAVLTHPTCPTEVPRLLNPAGGSPAASSREWVGLDAPGQSNTVLARSHFSYAQPLSDPLDRPPRPIAARGVIGLPV